MWTSRKLIANMKTELSKHGKPIFVLILVIGAVWIWLSKAPPGSTTGGEIPAPHAGFKAPEFSLEASDGQQAKLSDFRGQPVLINFWASWCAPCRAEMPAMQRVFQDYSGDGEQSEFTILAVNGTHQDNPADAMNFAQSYNLTFPILFDESGEVSRLYEVRALPTSFFVDAYGIIQEVVIGGPMAEALLRTRIETVLE